QRPAPGAEVLRGELVAEVDADVLVQPPRVEIRVLAVAAVEAEEPWARQLEQIADRTGELLVDDRAPDPDLVLAAIAERDARAAHADVALAQRRDPEGAGLLRVAVAPDAEPAEVDQPHGDRGDALG